MEFTKEELIVGKKLLDAFDNQNNYRNCDIFINSLLKPERKKIIVEIEYFKPDGCPDMQISYIKSKLEYFEKDDFVKITELPEMFTRQDMIEFANYHHHVDETVETNINDWLSEKKNNF